MDSLLRAFAFGFTIALAVGPIALLILNQAAAAGLGVGLRCALGAALADLTYALVAFLAGEAVAPALEAHRGPVRLLASAVLALFGLRMAWGGLRGLSAPAAAARAALPPRRALAGTYLLTLVNPLTVVAFAGFAGQLTLSGSPWRALPHALALGLGSALVQVALALCGALLGSGPLRDPRRLAGLLLLSGVGVLAFAVAGARG
jgi:threonine/homoserine/homoserine lactone efflux protein